MKLRKAAGLFLAFIMVFSSLNVCFAKKIKEESREIEYAVEGGNIYFENLSQTIIRADASITSAYLPSTIEGYEVKAIGEGVFQDNTNLKNVDIPRGITTIGDNAFAGCTSLEYIVITDSVTTISETAFDKCDKENLLFYVFRDSRADAWARKHAFTTTYDAAPGLIKTEPTTESPAILESDVKISIGSNVVQVGDKSYTVDAAPYIQASSNSTLVPLRFVSLAIANGDVSDAESDKIVKWDASTKTASVVAGGKIIKFTAGSNIMDVGGTPRPMEGGVVAEITDGRMFIPFKALGTAIGIDVEWDQSTKTATYKSDKK